MDRFMDNELNELTNSLDGSNNFEKGKELSAESMEKLKAYKDRIKVRKVDPSEPIKGIRITVNYEKKKNSVFNRILGIIKGGR